MGFLAGFGDSLNKSAELEHQANLAKQQEMIKSNLEMAKILLGGTPEQQAQGLAIVGDPTKPFRIDKPHPDTDKAKNILSAMGTTPAAQAVMQGAPAGMAGALGPDNSPLVQAGIIGDQGAPSQVGVPPPIGAGVPAVAPPTPPPLPSAAMSTNPPATQGGQISPAAVGAAPPAPPAGVPTPPPTLPSPVQAAISGFQSMELPPPPLNAGAQHLYYGAKLAQAQAIAQAQALAAGGSPEGAIATIGGKTAVPIETKKMGVDAAATQGDLNRGSRENIADVRAKTSREIADERIAQAKATLDQQWKVAQAKIGMAAQRLAQGGAGTVAGDKAELTRLTKIQTQMADSLQGSTSGLVGLERLRDRLNEFTGAQDLGEQAKAFYRLRDAASAEGSRLTQAMNPGVKGQRMNKDRIDAMVAEIMASKTVAGNLLPVLDPGEISKRLDTIDQLIRNSHDESMKLYTAQAQSRPQVGVAPTVGALPSHEDMAHPTAPPSGSPIPAGAHVVQNKQGHKLYSIDGDKTWLDAATGAKVY